MQTATDLRRQPWTGDSTAFPPDAGPDRRWLKRCLAAAPVVLFITGVALRVRILAANAPFFVDEAILARNIEARNYAKLFSPLLDNQAEPPGFLVFQKAVSSLFGRTEVAYRIFPFLCSIALLWIAWLLARKLLDRAGATVAFAIASLSAPLVAYSAFNKQYELEAVVTGVLLLLWMREDDSNWSRIAYAGACILSPWLSLSAPFVIAATETGNLIRHAGKGFLKYFLRRLPFYGLVLASCSLLFVAIGKQNESSTVLQEFWAYAFMPFPPRSMRDIGWFIGNFYETFRNPVGFPEPGVAPLLFLVGCFAIWRRRLAYIAAIPGMLGWTLLASGLHKYPFADRLLLFAVVPIALMIGLGFSSVLSLRGLRSPGGRALAAVLSGLLLIPICLTAASRLARPYTRLDFRQTYSFINTHWQANDHIIAQAGLTWQIEWYRDRPGGMPILGSKPLTIASKWSNCGDIRQMLLAQPTQGRTWIVLHKSVPAEGPATLFDWCTSDIGSKWVLSNPDEDLFLYSHR